MAVYTPNDIQRIHARGTAIHNQVYVSTSGLSYIGLPNGRLKLQEEADNVEFNPTTELPAENVQLATELTVAYINAQLQNYVPKTRKLTINGTTYDLSSNRTWSGVGVQDLQSVTDQGNVTTNSIEAASFITTGGTDEDFVLGDGSLSDVKKNRVINTVSTGLISGGQLSINGGDNTKFDVSAGKGLIIDNYTNADNPVIYEVSWTAFTAVTVTNLGTSTVTYVLIDNAGNIVQQTTPPDSEDHRDYIFLGQLGHANLTNIQTATNFPEVSVAPSDQLRDLEDAIGIINFGNTISANGANLKLNKASGSFVRSGINFHTNNKAPGVKTYASGTAITFRRRTQTGNGATGVDTLDVANYDNAGTITAIGGTKFQNMRVFLTLAGNVVIQYGQNTYNTMAEAIQAIQTESFVLFTNLSENAALIGIITVKSNATDLTSLTQAKFFTVSKFGELVGAASGTSVSTLQNAYDNSSTPEILTDGTRGAVTFKRGSAADTDNVIEGLNGTGTKTFSVTGNGKIFTGSETASRIASINANQEIESLDTTTYPSLSELAYVKGGGTKMYAYQNTTQTVTGTVAETIMCSLALPIMGANDGLRFESMVTSLGAGGTKIFTMYIGPTDNSLVGATQIGVLQHSTGTRLSAFVRHFVNKNSVSTNQIRSTTASLSNDYNDSNGNFNTVDINIDMSTQKYFMIAVTPLSAADTSTLRNVQVYWNRA